MTEPGEHRRSLSPRGFWIISAALLLLGAVVRIIAVAQDLPLWDDEARLALNIGPRSFSQLGPPFVGEQVAPMGYLLAVKAVTSAFGWADWVSRLTSLSGSIATLFVVWLFVRRLAGNTAALISLGVLALSPWSIRYGAELKPYATDALATSLCLFVGLRLCTDKTSLKDSLLIGLPLGLLAWCSLPAIFGLAAAGSALLLHDFKQLRGVRRFVRPALLGAFWLLCFVLHHRFVVQPSGMGDSAGARAHYAEGFAPFPPSSIADLRWYVGKFFYFFRTPGGLEGRYLVGLLFAIGALTLARKHLVAAVLVFGPLAFSLGASMAGQYPLQGQLLLFGLPCMFVGVALGVNWIFEQKHKAAPIVATVLALFIVFVRTSSTEAQMIEVEHERDVRDAVTTYIQERQSGDTIFIDQIELTFAFYAWRAGLKEAEFETIYDLRDDWDERRRFPRLPLIAEPLFGKARVWFMLPGTAPAVRAAHWRETNEPLDDFVLRYVERCGGKQLARWEASNAHLSLYDLSAARLPEGEARFKNPRRGEPLPKTATATKTSTATKS